jgi:hypothetical protein
VRLSEEAVLQHSPSSPVVIGNELTDQIHEYVKNNKMGYYPALDFFAMMREKGQGGLDPDLIDASESISWLLCRLVRNEFQTRLRQAFSSVTFQSVQTIAYTMPPVRYGANNTLHDLLLHYTPLSVKLDIELSMTSTHQPDEGVEMFISNTLYRLLEDSFESIEVGSVVSISRTPQ